MRKEYLITPMSRRRLIRRVRSRLIEPTATQNPQAMLDYIIWLSPQAIRVVHQWLTMRIKRRRQIEWINKQFTERHDLYEKLRSDDCGTITSRDAKLCIDFADVATDRTSVVLQRAYPTPRVSDDKPAKSRFLIW